MIRQMTPLSFANTHTTGLTLFLLGLFASPAYSASSVHLIWDLGPEPDLRGYYAHMGTSPGSYNTTVDVGLTRSYTFQNLQGGITYYFTVTAYNQSGNVSAPSEEVSIDIPAPGTNPNSPKNQDLNGDGTTDLVWHNTTTGEVAVWLLNGAGIAASAFLGGVPAEWALKGMGDVDGNNTADLIWRNTTSGLVAIWHMNGTAITSVSFPGATSTDWELP
jgi:hypothetical protein